MPALYETAPPAGRLHIRNSRIEQTRMALRSMPGGNWDNWIINQGEILKTEIELEGGKYTIAHEDGANLRAYRYGRPWRDLCGDGMVLAMAQEIVSLRAALGGDVRQCIASESIEKLRNQALEEAGNAAGQAIHGTNYSFACCTAFETVVFNAILALKTEYK